MLPAITDPDGDTVTKTLTASPTANFISIMGISTAPTLLIPDLSGTTIGTFTLLIKLDDSYSTRTYNINLTVRDNQPPAFNAALPASLTVTKTSSSEAYNYALPSISDPDGDPVTMAVTSSDGSNFISINGTP